MKRMLTLLVLLAGCAHYGQPIPCNVLEADQAMVQGCRFVGTVEGHTYFLGPHSFEAARDDARLAAQEMGATHIVMVAAASNGRGYEQAYARAYQCPR